MRRSATIVLVAFAWCAASCGPIPDLGHDVAYQVLGYAKAGVESKILASTSLGDLRALMAGDHNLQVPIYANDFPSCEWGHPELVKSCNRDDFGAWSGVKVPGGSLLVATSTYTTGGMCSVGDIESLRLSGTTLTLTLKPRNRPCGSGEDDGIWLLAVPLKSLPASVLTLKISPPTNGHNAGYPTDYLTVVDLTSPIPAPPLDITRAMEVESAIVAAKREVLSHLHRKIANDDWYMAGLGVQRWPDAGLGCTPSGEHPAPTPVSGYVVVVVLRATHDIQVDQTYQMHVGGGRALYCSGP